MVDRQLHLLLHKSVAGLTFTVFATALGCESKEEIRHYTVDRPAQNASAAASGASIARPQVSGEPTDRMLAAILPAGDQAYFFKVVGPIAAIEKRESDLFKFFHSLKTVEGGPGWTAPASWKVDPASGLRRATIWVPADSKPLEMSVTVLPWGGAGADMLSNVNRWREQMQLPAIGPEELEGDITEIETSDATVTIVDLSGWFAGGGMMAPFAGGRAGAANPTAPRFGSELPPGHPPVDSSAAAAPNSPAADVAAAGVPSFEAPKSWRSVPASGLRKAQFNIGGAAQGATVTLMDFSTNAGPLMTDPLANVNRWRTEIGLANIEEEQLAESAQSIEIDGKPAKYVRLVPDASRPQESKIEMATVAAMVTVGEKIWFVKLFGHRDTVVAEEENFKAFLKSMQFADGGGASSGNK